jgi:SPOR domain
MTDIRADESQGDDSRLPWLEAVDEEEEGQGGPSPLKLIVAVLIGLAAIGAVVGGLFWLGNRDRAGGSGDAQVIEAPAGAYKVRPDDPGGMAVEGEGDAAFAASAGDDPKGAIDTTKVAEQPVTRAPKAAPPAAKAPPAGAPPAKAPPAPAPAPAASGPTIQLGAFSSQAGAAKAWTALSARFAYLAPLAHSVVPVASGGRTLYRLRASGANAANVCGRLRVAGESCVVVD